MIIDEDELVMLFNKFVFYFGLSKRTLLHFGFGLGLASAVLRFEVQRKQTNVGLILILVSLKYLKIQVN